MNDESKKSPGTTAPTAADKATVLAALPSELLPVYDWWKTHGNKLLLTVAGVTIVFSAAFIVMRYRSGRVVEAAIAAFAAHSIDELESVVNRYGKTPSGISARLRLAKAYYDAEKYEDALNAYETFMKRHGSHPLVAIAELGRAQALEGLNRPAEAIETFRAFRKAHEGHYLAPVAWMGEARCLALQGRKKEALALLDDLRLAKAGTPWNSIAQELRGVIERFDGRSLTPVSLLDQANVPWNLMPPAETNAPVAP